MAKKVAVTRTEQELTHEEAKQFLLDVFTAKKKEWIATNDFFMDARAMGLFPPEKNIFELQSLVNELMHEGKLRIEYVSAIPPAYPVLAFRRVKDSDVVKNIKFWSDGETSYLGVCKRADSYEIELCARKSGVRLPWDGKPTTISAEVLVSDALGWELGEDTDYFSSESFPVWINRFFKDGKEYAVCSRLDKTDFGAKRLGNWIHKL